MQKEMIYLLLAWQEWEIAFIFGNTEWNNGLPLFSHKIFDNYLELQKERERLLEELLERGKIDDMPVV